VIYARTRGAHVAVEDGAGRTFLVDHARGPDLDRLLAACPAAEPAPEPVSQVAFDHERAAAGSLLHVAHILPTSGGGFVAATYGEAPDLDLTPAEAATLRLAIPRPAEMA
jgi:hypothetical protein